MGVKVVCTCCGEESVLYGEKVFEWKCSHCGSAACRVISRQKENLKPDQYSIGIDTIERAKANLTPAEIIAVAKFNIDKYCWRKKGQDIDDMKKLKDYADLAIWAYEQKGK